MLPMWRTAFNRVIYTVFLTLALLVASAEAQTISVLPGRPSFGWPRTRAQALAANNLSDKQVGAFLDSLGRGPVVVPSKVLGFRFVNLEAGRVYLVASLRARQGWLEAVYPTGGSRFGIVSLGAPNGALPASLLDLRGNGVEEVIGRRLVNYRGAFTDPIYWYTIYAFHDGKPVDVSAQFPEFYRDVVLPRLDYLGRVFGWIKMNVPAKLLQGNPAPLGKGAPDIELAEIGFVRLKYQHVILGNKNAGLDEAIKWAKSPNTDIAVLGVRSLGEMTAPEAWEEIHKLWNSPNFAVCSEARGFWLKRIGKPYTEKYVCPSPGARR